MGNALNWMINNVPTGLLGVILVALAILVAVIFLVTVRRKFPSLQNSKHELVFMQLVGTVYAVLLVFVLIAVWRQYEEARRTLEEEGALLDSLWHIALVYPEEHSVPIVTAIAAYSKAVSEDEWKTLANGEESQVAGSALAELRAAHFDMDLPITNRFSSLYNQSIEKLESVAEHRLLRFIQSRTSVPDIVWTVLIFAGMMLVGLTALVQEKNIALHAALTGILTAIIATTLYVIVLLDNPWSSSAALEPEAFEHIHSMQLKMHPELGKP